MTLAVSGLHDVVSIRIISRPYCADLIEEFEKKSEFISQVTYMLFLTLALVHIEGNGALSQGITTDADNLSLIGMIEVIMRRQCRSGRRHRELHMSGWKCFRSHCES